MPTSFFVKARWAYHLFVQATSMLQSPLLLVLRTYWGWSFFVTGKGKLLSLDRTAEFFSGLGLPFPELNALLAGSTECFGGFLLLIGLGSRLVSLPLAFTMLVAYFTADREALFGLFSEPDKFLAADPFLFLLVSVIVLAFGPGVFSLDWLIARRLRTNAAVKV